MMMSNEAPATRAALLDRIAPGCKNLIRLLKDFDYTLRSVSIPTPMHAGFTFHDHAIYHIAIELWICLFCFKKKICLLWPLLWKNEIEVTKGTGEGQIIKNYETNHF